MTITTTCHIEEVMLNFLLSIIQFALSLVFTGNGGFVTSGPTTLKAVFILNAPLRHR